MKRFIAPVLVSAAALTGCGADDLGSESQNHTAGRVLSQNTPYAYVDTSYDAYLEATHSGSFWGMGSGTALADDDPIAVRLQAWADSFHEAVAKQHRGRTGEVLRAPRPVIKVLDSGGPNAWVSAVPACVGGEVEIWRHHRPEDDSEQSDYPASIAYPWKDSARTGAQACTPARNWENPDAAAQWHAGLKKACRYEKKGDGYLLGGKYCETTYETHASAAALMGSSPYINFTAKLISMLDNEKAAVAILAHELGHYYRAHVSNVGEYDYWYEQQLEQLPAKPEPVVDSDALKDKYERVRSTIQAARIEGAIFSHRLTSFAFRLAEELGEERQEQPALCPGVADGLGSWRYELTGRRVDREAAEKYLDLEQKLVACAASVSVSEDGAPGTLALQFIERAYLPREISEPAVGPGNLGQILELLNGRARLLDAEGEAFLDEMNRRRLGIYTSEQEADDISLELITLVGLDPQDHVEAWLDFMRALDEDPDSDWAFAEDLSFDECVALYENDWKQRGESGRIEYTFVSMGNLDSPHHGFCYRLFNLTRERDAHAYEVVGTPPNVSVPWETVVQHARDVIAGPDDPAPAPVDDGGDAGFWTYSLVEQF